jgi:hypothetical protein
MGWMVSLSKELRLSRNHQPGIWEGQLLGTSLMFLLVDWKCKESD